MRQELDARFTSAFRVAVAAAGLGVSHLASDGSPPPRPRVYAVFGAFVLYSIVNHLLMLQRARRLSPTVAPWIERLGDARP